MAYTAKKLFDHLDIHIWLKVSIFTSLYGPVVLVFTNEGKYVNLTLVTHCPDSVILGLQMHDFEKFL